MEKLRIEAKKENLNMMIDFIVDKYSEKVTGKKAIHKMRLVSEEALINVIDYAYPDKNGELEIRYEYNKEDDFIEIRIIDEGKPFNPLEHDKPDLDTAVEDREIGGLGIFMIKQIMDKVIYERKDQQNILTLIKHISKEGS
jgi:anti-sigma regulatory factor (Ser/Thr protein kinase)